VICVTLRRKIKFQQTRCGRCTGRALVGMFTISTHRQFNAGGDNCAGGNDADGDDKTEHTKLPSMAKDARLKTVYPVREARPHPSDVPQPGGGAADARMRTSRPVPHVRKTPTAKLAASSAACCCRKAWPRSAGVTRSTYQGTTGRAAPRSVAPERLSGFMVRNARWPCSPGSWRGWRG
jgi:hypothetical protein